MDAYTSTCDMFVDRTSSEPFLLVEPFKLISVPSGLTKVIFKTCLKTAAVVPLTLSESVTEPVPIDVIVAPVSTPAK